MLVTHSSMQPVGDRLSVRPLCPNCGRSMHLARITPRPGGLTDLQTFGCGECGVWATEAVKITATELHASQDTLKQPRSPAG